MVFLNTDDDFTECLRTHGRCCAREKNLTVNYMLFVHMMIVPRKGWSRVFVDPKFKRKFLESQDEVVGGRKVHEKEQNSRLFINMSFLTRHFVDWHISSHSEGVRVRKTFNATNERFQKIFNSSKCLTRKNNLTDLKIPLICIWKGNGLNRTSHFSTPLLSAI